MRFFEISAFWRGHADLLRCRVHEFARQGAVADACVSCPWCTEIGGVPEDGYAIARETLGEIKGPYAKREAPA